MSTTTAPRALSLWKSHEGHDLTGDEGVQIMAQRARCSNARPMCGELSILSSYLFLYLDYCAGGSVRAAASSTCDQMRRGSLFTCTFTRLRANSRISSITIDMSYYSSSSLSAILVKTLRLIFDQMPKGLCYAVFTTDLFAPSSSSPGPALSFSHGFFRLAVIIWEACPSSTMLGTSLIPGIGCPLVISSTI